MVHGSDVTEDVLEGVGTELHTPHILDEVCVNYSPCNATFFLIAPFCQHPHVLDFVCVGTRHWIDEVERMVNCVMHHGRRSCCTPPTDPTRQSFLVARIL